MKQTIRQIRESRMLTQQQLAGRLRVSLATISKWERGVHMPVLSHRATICKVLHVEATEVDWPRMNHLEAVSE